MNIVIIGTGYVGLVSGVCFAEIGNNVVCVDNNLQKIEQLKTGTPTIYEDQLEGLLKKNISEGRLTFAAGLSSVIDSADLVFVAVGTPEKDNGETDLSYILGVAKGIAESANKDVYVVIKSTVPVGTKQKVEDEFYKTTSSLDKDIKIFVSSNPEFLREGTSIYDFMNPDRIVIGTDDEVSKSKLEKLYSLFAENAAVTPYILYTSVASAQLIKYASNAFNACKISFINSLAEYCSAVDANIEEVALGMGLDKRIGTAFLKAGIGYGGSCFPKDIASLSHEIEVKTEGKRNKLLDAIEYENGNARWFVSNTLHDLTRDKKIDKNATVAILGLAFKPGTDDVRHAPALDIIEEESYYYKMKLYDPVALHNATVALNSDKYEEVEFYNIEFCNSIEAAVTDADVIVICTEWPEFKNMDLNWIKSLMKGNTIIDGRNIFDRDTISKDFNYYCVGKKHIE